MNDNDNEEAFEVFDACVSTVLGAIKLVSAIALLAFMSGVLYATFGG